MRAPDFWFRPPDRPGWLSGLLRPLGRIYAQATARRLAREIGLDPGVPVICVGNLSVGGTGKTPTAIWLAERLAASGHTPIVVSRGYGGRLEGPVLVDPGRHDATDVGDEALLLSAFCGVVVARDRGPGGAAAARAGATAIILDDGFQNPGLRKDFSILVVDAETGFGNGRCLPAGPLREPVPVGLARADAVLALGDETAIGHFRGLWGDAIAIPVFSGQLAPLNTGMDWDGARLLAFAGIGRPQKFFATLRGLGADLVRTEALDDHQPLSPALIRRMEADARALGAQLVTTEKDAVRLPPETRGMILTLPVRLGIAKPDWLDAQLARIAPPPE